MIICTLKQYLSEIDAIEKSKPVIERLHVPSLKNISEEADIHYTTLSRIANNKVKRLDYRTGSKVIKAIRARGFDMGMTDLVDFREA